MRAWHRFAVAVAVGLGISVVGAVPASAAPSTQDIQFLQQAHQSNLFEIATGQVAQERGNSQVVRDLGARFEADHTRLDQSLQQVAAALGVSLPDSPNAEQQAIANRLENTSGQAFDTLFVTTQLDAHMAAMALGETEIRSGSDPQVIQLARDAAPVIAAHHEALESAATELGIPLSVEAGTGGYQAAGRSYLLAGLVAGGLALVAVGLLRRRRPE